MSTRLHLGCGERYLEGYLNIDFPPSSHTVQKESVADLRADLTELCYPAGSLEEIRLHHVFEHFPRPVACGLMAAWHSWLRPGGLLRIEVPDFYRTAINVLNPFVSLRKRAAAERHLFGSHEAPWAVHCEGYTPALLQEMLSTFGFAVETVKKNAWRGTHNFEVYARCLAPALGKEAVTEGAVRYLRNFLVDEGQGELRLLAIWMETFAAQLEKGWAR